MKKYHFVYKTTNLLNGIYYIGVRTTNNIDDGYLGSGLILRKAIKKHGKENFKREIIKFFDSKKDAYEFERNIVTEDLIKTRNVYNRAVGGQGGYLGKEVINKIRQSKIGSIPWNKGTRQSLTKCIDCNKNINTSYGKTQKRCKLCSLQGVLNPVWKGYYLTPKGIFHSIKSASYANNLPKTTLRRYSHSNKYGFRFVSKNSDIQISDKEQN